MWKCSSCDEVLANEHDTCKKCGTINIGVGDSADSEQESQSDSVARSPKLRFSIRTMLIAVAVVAIGAAGYQFWVQSTTEYMLQGTISFVLEDWSKLIDGDVASIDANYHTGDESIECWISSHKNFKNGLITTTINYGTTANYYNKADKIDDLETLLKKTERRKINSNLHFHKIWIGEGQRGGRIKLIKEIPLDKAK